MTSKLASIVAIALLAFPCLASAQSFKRASSTSHPPIEGETGTATNRHIVTSGMTIVYDVTASSNDDSPTFRVGAALAHVCLTPDLDSAGTGAARGWVRYIGEDKTAAADRGESSHRIHDVAMDGTASYGCVWDIPRGQYYLEISTNPAGVERARFEVVGD